MTQTKTCTKCHKTKPLEEFSRGPNCKDGYQTHCKACKSAYSRRWRVGRREKTRVYNSQWWAEHGADRQRQRLYGITLAEYDAMLEAQGGVCAICGMTPEENKARLSVDHDHETREIRGLLCSGCNWGLGMFRDNPNHLYSAVEYLEYYREYKMQAGKRLQ